MSRVTISTVYEVPDDMSAEDVVAAYLDTQEVAPGSGFYQSRFELAHEPVTTFLRIEDAEGRDVYEHDFPG